MKVFVTGGTGLLGNHVVRELQGRGHEVLALVRSPETARGMLGDDVALVAGDLMDPEPWKSRMEGMDTLIHAAACYGEFYRGGSASATVDTNVSGTVGLLDAAVARGISNIVYVSSAAVLAEQDDGPTDESCPYADKSEDPYFFSKIEAEKAVLSFQENHPHIRIVSVLPSVMLGPGDRGPTPTGSFVLKLLRGEMKFVLPGAHRIADARDVAHAVVEAMRRGKQGERYLVGGPKVPMAEIYQTLTEVTGRPTPTQSITPGKLMMMSRLMTVASWITRRPPPIKPNIVKRLQAPFWYSSAKAQRDLGVTFRPLSETLADTASWFQQEMTRP